MKILLAIDGSACSERAVDEIARRVWEPDSEVKIITAISPVVPVAIGPAAPLVTFSDEMMKVNQDRAHALLARAVEKLRGASVGDSKLQISTEVHEGSPKQIIVEVAEAWGADLIVLGSHGYGAVKRFLLGSVSQAVAIHASCSVEIVR